MPNPNYKQDWYFAQHPGQKAALEGLKGLRGWRELSQEERSSWLDAHPKTKARGYNDEDLSTIYRNKNLKEVLGEDVYNAYDVPTLEEMYKDKLVNDAITSYYKDDKLFNSIMQLSTDNKIELLNSEFPNEAETKQDIVQFETGIPIEGEVDNRKQVFDRIFQKDINEKVASVDADREALETYLTQKINDNQSLLNEYNKVIAGYDSLVPGGGVKATEAAPVAKNASYYNRPQTKPRDSYEALRQGLLNPIPYDAELARQLKAKDDAAYREWEESQAARERVYKDLDREGVDIMAETIIPKMVEEGVISKEKGLELTAKGNTKERDTEIQNILNITGTFSPFNINEELRNMLYGHTVYVDDVRNPGNKLEVNIPGSPTYKAYQSSDRFQNFTQADKIHEYAIYTALANKYGIGIANSNLEKRMKEYAKENETWADFFEDVGTNILLGGYANIMNAVNAVNNFGVWAIYGDEALQNKLEGKNRDGSERSKSNDSALDWFANNWDNPAYWQKVDEYNTIDPFEINYITEELNGMSPHVSVPTDNPGFFSRDALREALKMGKFVWSGAVIAGAGSLAGDAAGSLFGLGSKTTGMLQGVSATTASALGISESYGVMAYEKALQENLALSEESLGNKADAIIKEELASPEVQAEIDTEVKRRKEQYKDSDGKVSYVNEDLLKQEVEDEWKRSRFNELQQSEEFINQRAIDQEIAKDAATNAYKLTATIDAIRYSYENFAFRKFLFDKNVRRALGDNKAYSKLVSNEDGTLSRKRGLAGRAKEALKPVYGGFYSNFMDDIVIGGTTGYSKGQYLDYLSKVDSPDKNAELLDYDLSIWEGITSGVGGAIDAAADRQTWFDGWIGGTGSIFTITPRIGSGRADAVERMNRVGQDLTATEKINKWIMNPILDAYYTEKGRQERTEKILPIVNKVIEDNRDSFDKINKVVIAMTDNSLASLSESHREKKDEKDINAFTLLYDMMGASSSGAITESSIIKNAAGQIDRLAKGKVTEEEIDLFLNQPENKTLKSRDNAREIAAQTIRDNAKTLQDMAKRINDANSLIENSIINTDIDPSLKAQLVYQLAMDKSWSERLSSIEEKISGSRTSSKAHNTIAAYGSKEEYQRQLQAQKELVKKLSTKLEKAGKDKKTLAEVLKDPDATEFEKQGTKWRSVVNVLKEKTTAESLREAREKLVAMEKEGYVFDTDNLSVLTAEEILSLSPTDRATILNPKNRSNYSEAQRAEIRRAEDNLRAKLPDAQSYVEDAAVLNDRIADNKKAYNKLQSDPDLAAAYVRDIKENRADRLTRAVALKRIETGYKLLDKADGGEALVNTARVLLNSKEFGFNSEIIKDYIEENPARNSVLQGLLDVAKLREDAYGAINETVSSRAERDAITKMVVGATTDVNSKEEAMSAIENLIDIQTDVTAKMQLDRVLESMKTKGYQRDATKIRDRELERQKKQEAEVKRLEEEERKKKQLEEEKKKAEEKKPQPTDLSEITPKKEVTPEMVETAELIATEDVPLEIDSEGRTSSPTAEQQAAANGTVAIEVPTEDVAEQGNVIPENQDNVISGNRLVEYSINALKDGVVRPEVAESENSSFDKFRKWLDSTKTKLQEIIDEEFSRMVQDNPDTKVQFMIMKQDDPNNPFSSIHMLFNVVELTPEVRNKYHKEERGGVIQANGKAWLVVGTTGFEKSATAEQRKAFDTMRGPINKRGISYFSENASEAYYVDPIAYSTVQNTTSGRIINQKQGEEAPRLRKVSELLAEGGKTLKKAEFGIQTNQAVDEGGKKSFATTKNVDRSKVKVFPPRNIEDNRGRTFILIDTPNGNKIPGMIEPTMFNNLEEGSPLKDAIDATLAQLTSTNYETRLKAISELRGFLVLNEDTNILIGTNKANVITITRAGMPNITQQLGEKFDRTKFLSDIRNANFQINTTIKILEDPYMLKLYDDSGALMTSVASTRTVGSSYTLYMTDATGKPIITIPRGNATPGTGEPRARTYRSVRVNNTTYEYRNGQFVNRSTGEKVDPTTALGKSCLYNQAITEGNWKPFDTRNGKEYYSVMGTDGNLFVVERDGLGNITELSQQESEAINLELQRQLENKARLESLEDVDLGDETPTTQEVEVADMTIDEINKQMIGDFTKEEKKPTPEPVKEVVEEAKQVSPQQTKEVITDVGTKSLAELQNTENLSTFEEIAGSTKYSDALFMILEDKGWGINDNMTYSEIADMLKSKGISVVGITNIEDWMNLIRDCR